MPLYSITVGGSGFTPKNWRRRWFVLKDGKLYYYKTSFVSIYSCLVIVLSELQFCTVNELLLCIGYICSWHS